MLLFYRQLDLLNRLYILNYCQVELLEAAFIPEVPKNIALLQLKPPFYFNLSNTAFLISAFSTKKIKFIIDKIIFEVLSENNETAVNGVLLRRLVGYFSKKDFAQLLNQGARMSNSKFDKIIAELTKHRITDIFYHFIHALFKDVANSLNINFLERFIANYKLDKNLLAVVNELPLYTLLDKVVTTYMPYVNTVTSQIYSRSVALPHDLLELEE